MKENLGDVVDGPNPLIMSAACPLLKVFRLVAHRLEKESTAFIGVVVPGDLAFFLLLMVAVSVRTTGTFWQSPLLAQSHLNSLVSTSGFAFPMQAIRFIGGLYDCQRRFIVVVGGTRCHVPTI